MTRLRLMALGALSASLLMLSVGAAGASAKAVITMTGSTSIYPLIVPLATAYVKANRGKAGFKIAQGGSDIGVADAAAGRVSVGLSSRDPKPTDPGGIVWSKFARDAVCLITNPKNRLNNLSTAQVQDIYSGRIRDWKQVQGATVTGPISIIARTAASGTQDAFQRIFMGTRSVSSGAATKASNGLVQQTVKSDPRAIGYVSLDFVAGTNVASYQGISCNLRNAKSGQYKGTRNFWMVTRGKPKGAIASFIKWSQNAGTAKRIIGTHWVPLK